MLCLKWSVCGGRVMPIKECEANDNTVFVLTKFGSHCGHMQGWWPLGQSWLDIVVMEFFKAILTKHGQPTAAASVHTGSDPSAGGDLASHQ